ncbi:MAG: outer membrane beta-barrel family protein [Rikenellaceae bacterium]
MFWTSAIQAQKPENEKITIIGMVVDSVSGKSIEYPTVALFTDSLKLLKAIAGGADGKFILEAPGKGKYFLSASMLGYTNSKSEINLDGISKCLDVGKISLIEGLQLAEVTVVGVKPLIKNDPDKLTYNLEADPQTASSTVSEILRKVPMLSVDGEGTVRMNGETNFKVLVNGKSSGILVKNFKDVIKAMPASAIKSVEVITNPPAKYDAEGIGGIINIITNKKTTNGYSGSMNFGLNTLGGYNDGGYISAQVGKFALSTNIYNGKNVSNKSSYFSETENFVSDDYRFSRSERKYNSDNNFTMFGIDASYEIDSLNLITLSGSGYFGTSSSDGKSTYTAMNISNILTRKYLNTSNSEYGYGSGSGSVSYQRTFKKPDQNLTISYSLDANPVSTDVTNTIDPELNYISYSQHSKNEASAYEHTAQVDYYDPISNKHQIETGVKYILRQNVSNTKIKRYDEATGNWVDDMSRVNDLDYDQHIGSIYGGYVFKHKSLTAKAGFRMEYTFNDGVSKSSSGDIQFNNKQFDVVPYINFSYLLKKGSVLSLAFTQRLNRPGIWYLNPYVNDSDPMNISFGNPDLKTVRRNSINAGFRKSSQRWNLGLNIMANFTKNNVESITRVEPSGARITTYDNIGVNNSYRLNTNYSYRYDTKFNFNLNFSMAYTTVSTYNSDLKNSGFSFNGGFGSSAGLWKKATFDCGVYLFGGNITLQSKNPLIYMASMGISQKFLKDKLTLSLYVNEPFENKKVYKYDSKDVNYRTHSESASFQRSASFSLLWRFGKFNANVKKARKSVIDDKMSGGSPASGGK